MSNHKPRHPARKASDISETPTTRRPAVRRNQPPSPPSSSRGQQPRQPYSPPSAAAGNPRPTRADSARERRPRYNGAGDQRPPGEVGREQPREQRRRRDQPALPPSSLPSRSPTREPGSRTRGLREAWGAITGRHPVPMLGWRGHRDDGAYRVGGVATWPDDDPASWPSRGAPAQTGADEAGVWDADTARMPSSPGGHGRVWEADTARMPSSPARRARAGAARGERWNGQNGRERRNGWAGPDGAASSGSAAVAAYPPFAPTQRRVVRRAQRRRLLATRRSRLIATVTCAIVLACALASSLVGVSQALHASGLAQDGARHLSAAKSDFQAIGSNPFDQTTIAHARAELVAAHADFAQLSSYSGTLGAAGIVPVVGGKAQAANALLPVAINGTAAGIVACDTLSLLAKHLSGALSASAPAMTSADLAAIQRDVAQLEPLALTTLNALAQLPPDVASLDARLGPMLQALKASLPQLRQGVQSLVATAKVAGSLLGVGAPANYLVEMLDSTELRPGGGFIGNFGFLTLAGGKLQNLHIQDVTLLNNPAQHPYPPLPASERWYPLAHYAFFQDSNIEADFPWSAQNGIALYHQQGGDVNPVGVIAITPWLIQKAMSVTGPIPMPEYGVTITPQNMVDEIHYHQLTYNVYTSGTPIPGDSQRKAFSGTLFAHFMDKVRALQPGQRSAFYRIIFDALRTKDLQVYLTPPSAEQLLDLTHLAGTIQAPAQGDSLLVVDANVTPNKANYFMNYTLTDVITLGADGSATHHTTLTYKWPPSADSQANTYGPMRYRDYLRVYVPPKAILLKIEGVDQPATSKAFGRQVWAGWLYVNYGSTAAVSYTWTSPGAATHDAQGWHYTDLIQKQAGITWQMGLQVVLPSCAHTTAAPAGLNMKNATTAAAWEALIQDSTVAVTYNC